MQGLGGHVKTHNLRFNFIFFVKERVIGFLAETIRDVATTYEYRVATELLLAYRNRTKKASSLTNNSHWEEIMLV